MQHLRFPNKANLPHAALWPAICKDFRVNGSDLTLKSSVSSGNDVYLLQILSSIAKMKLVINLSFH